MSLVGLSLRVIGRKHIFVFVRFIACINTYLFAKFKTICQGEVCKIDKPLSLSIKTLKNMTPGKDGKWNISFFKFEILETNTDQSQILKNICQQLLSLNNILKNRDCSLTYPDLREDSQIHFDMGNFFARLGGWGFCTRTFLKFWQ